MTALTARAVLLADHVPPICRNLACRQEMTRRPDGGWGGARGWCRPCYDRWLDAGKPESGPPPPMPRSERPAAWNALRREQLEERIAEFARLRARDVPVAVAARRIGVSLNTAYDYSSVLRKRQQEAEAA